MAIAIVINGELQQVPVGLTVLDLLHRLDIHPERVAVELNRVIIRQPNWDKTLVEDKAQLEIVQFVGGG